MFCWFCWLASFFFGVVVTTEPLPETLPYALDYAARGWPVFPIRPRTKKPRTAHGSSDATTNTDLISKWWTQWPHDGIGGIIPLGWCVIDIDPRNRATLTPEDLPATLTTRTGGGWHCYFLRPGLDLTKSSSDPRLVGVDLILGGRGITLPPTLHPNGRRYEWVRDQPPVALPSWVAAAFQRPARPACTSARAGMPGPLLDAFQRTLIEVSTAADGTRNRTLRNAAYFAGGLVAAGVLDGRVAEQMLLSATGLTGHEATSTIRGGIRDGAAQPLTVKGTK
jgi:hypothetical protein